MGTSLKKRTNRCSMQTVIFRLLFLEPIERTGKIDYTHSTVNKGISVCLDQH
jgi:hypothetical protein